MKKHTAFSIVELSIVILVIGLIIGGISTSTYLIKQFRLSNARSLTQSSPVSSIEGLVGWWEPVMEEILMLMSQYKAL